MAGLLIVLVLTLLSMTAMMNVVADLKSAANDRSAKEAFYQAEAGAEEARSRLQAGADSPVSDLQPANPAWTAFIGSPEKAAEKGFQSGNGNHVRLDCLSPNLNYIVTITHKLDDSGNVLRWGDQDGDGIPEENPAAGESIYVITSEGYPVSGGTRAVRQECARVAAVPAPAALYTKANITIQGSSTSVIGLDGCGAEHKPGVITRGTVAKNGSPTVTGSPSAIQENSPLDLNVSLLIDRFKGRANFNYRLESATLSGVNWGVPSPGLTSQSPSSCAASNVVYIDTRSTYVQLSGGGSGCGVLLVAGDLSVQGGFQWYGIILATGSITFAGGGGKNVTGAVLAGGSVSADLVSGEATIVYCNQAVRAQTDHLPLATWAWMELFN